MVIREHLIHRNVTSHSRPCVFCVNGSDRSMCVRREKRRILGGRGLTGDMSSNSLRGMEKGWEEPQILQPLSGKRSKPESSEHYSRWPNARPQVSVCIA